MPEEIVGLEGYVSHFSRKAIYELDVDPKDPFKIPDELARGFREAIINGALPRRHISIRPSERMQRSFAGLGVAIRGGRIYDISIDVDVDSQPRSDRHYNLVQITLNGRKLLLEIREHNNIGIDPSFLYRIGEKYGRRIEGVEFGSRLEVKTQTP